MSSRYPLNLPTDLKIEAENLAAQQGVSFNQFVLWAVAEKVASMRSELNDLRFPHIVYRLGPAGLPVPVIARTNLRLQTVVIAARQWNMSPQQIAKEFSLRLDEVKDALAFYEAHQDEINRSIKADEQYEASIRNVSNEAAS